MTHFFTRNESEIDFAIKISLLNQLSISRMKHFLAFFLKACAAYDRFYVLTPGLSGRKLSASIYYQIVEQKLLYSCFLFFL
jgi:hypothetical protein